MINNIFRLILFLLFTYIVLFPFYPKVQYQFAPEIEPQPIQITKQYSLEKTIQIPKMKVDTTLSLGSTEQDLDRGVILLDKYSSPDQMGNTVITAHRFLYTEGSETFYHIDKMEKGDLIYINWLGKQYTYQVNLVDKVTPDDPSLLSNDTSRQYITLYSCAPLLKTTHRRVVRAELISIL